MREKQLPLAGIRVTDFAQMAAGPAASKMLADYGAEVIMVESADYIEVGGGSRRSGPQGTTSVNGGWFHNKFNTNKLSITVNLRSPEGMGVLRRLISVSDIFIANRRPQVLERLGLTYDALRAMQPPLIYVTMPMMSHEGPRNFYSASSWQTQAMAGLNMISGFTDRPPTSPSPYSHPDVSCNPLHAATAILAALRHRRRTGQGQRIEVSQYESAICWTGTAVLQYTANGTLQDRSENRHRSAAPHDVFRCQGDDSWCAISVFSDVQWRALCEAIGRPELAGDPASATLLVRKAHEEDLRAIIELWTSQRMAEEVTERLQQLGVPCYRLNNLEQLLRGDPQLKERALWCEVEHPEFGTLLNEGWGFRLPKTPYAERRRAPLLGEHNAYVFGRIIGMSEDEIDAYSTAGVLR